MFKLNIFGREYVFVTSEREKEIYENQTRYEELKEIYDKSFCPKFLELVEDITYEAIAEAIEELELDVDESADELLGAMANCVFSIIDDNKQFYLVSPDNWTDLVGRVTYIKYLDDFSDLLKQDSKEVTSEWESVIKTLVKIYLEALPVACMKSGSNPIVTLPVTQNVRNVPDVLQGLLDTVIDARPLLFGVTALQLKRNMQYAADLKRPQQKPAFLWPKDYVKHHNEVTEDLPSLFLQGTALKHFFDVNIPLSMPDETRFSHTWCVAPTGSGKSTLLQGLINSDLDLVAQDKASLIIMESKRDLIAAVQGLKRFTTDLKDKLIIIDCEDAVPIALNLFDMQLEDLHDFTDMQQEALYTTTVHLLEYVFRSLVGAEFTSKQSTLFSFTIELLLAIPESSLDTLLDLMEQGAGKYESYISSLSSDAQRYFRTKFTNDKSIRSTKSQVAERIYAVKRYRGLSRMFSAKKNRLNFYKELSSSKVILINAASAQLGQEGTEIFQRFFLAFILLAIEKRQFLPRSKRLPTYFYIDECQTAIRNDEKIETILTQARSLNVGMILANQDLSQVQRVAPALNGTAIKFATELAGNDARALASQMRCKPEFITNQPPYHFACFIRRSTQEAVSIKVPYVDMMEMERMTGEEFKAIKEKMRAKYSAPSQEVEIMEDEEDMDDSPQKW